MKVKKGGFSCAMENCENISGQMSGLSFFRFPRDSERDQLWLRNCGRTIDNSTKNLHNNHRVCGDHFKDTMFLNDLKNRLQPHAIPTATNANANTSVLISNKEITFSNSRDTDLTNPVVNEKSINEINQEIHECSQPDDKLDDKSDKETQTHNKLTSSSPRKQILKKNCLLTAAVAKIKTTIARTK